MHPCWMRAFGDSDSNDAFIRDVVLRGPAPSPTNIDTDTAEDEAALGIKPRHVYFYLSRLDPAFGEIALVCGPNAVTGTVAPFDSGGLLRRIQPVCTWGIAEQRRYLGTYSFSAADLLSLMAKYPGTTAAAFTSYVNGTRPSIPGPEVLLEGDPPIVADIWAQPSNMWRAWAWEGREPNRVDSLTHLQFWSSSTDVYNMLRDHVETLPDKSSGIAILKRWRSGGPGQLFRRYLDGELSHA